MAVNVVELQDQVKDMFRQVADGRFPQHQDLVKKLVKQKLCH